MGNKKTVTIKQIKDVYRNLDTADCRLTEKLIKAGYQQLRGGYIQIAKKYNEPVNYADAKPTQHWHLFKSYFEEDMKAEDKKRNFDDNDIFPRSVSCGELLFWMAEVLDCFDDDNERLKELCKEITEHPIPCEDKPRYNKKGQTIFCRSKWNKEIHDLCFDKIVEKVEEKYNEMQKNNPV